jgi:predicted N-acetyltransferase YhbS
LGSQLVRLCLDKARYAGIPLFLCSVPSAHGFYRKLGFVDVAYVDVDLSVWSVKYGGYGIYRLQGMLASI